MLYEIRDVIYTHPLKLQRKTRDVIRALVIDVQARGDRFSRHVASSVGVQTRGDVRTATAELAKRQRFLCSAWILSYIRIYHPM